MARQDTRVRVHLSPAMRRVAQDVAAMRGGTLPELMRAALREQLEDLGAWPPAPRDAAPAPQT